MKRLLLPLVALVVLSAALAGCGQKGPLYLPDDGDNAKAHKSHQHSSKAKPTAVQEQPPAPESEPEQSPAQ